VNVCEGVHVCVCMCVCERERETERERDTNFSYFFTSCRMGDAVFDDVMQVRNNCWAYVDPIESRKKTKQKYNSAGAVATRFERDAIVRQEKKDAARANFNLK